MKLLIAFALFGCALAANVEPQIYKNLEESETTNVLVTFKKANSKAALARFESLRLVGREARLNTMYTILKDHADIVTGDVASLLEQSRVSKTHEVAQLWISSELIVRHVDKEVVELLNNHPDVESLQAEFFLPLLPTEETFYNETEIGTLNAQWGVEHVRAEAVWATGVTGVGIVAGVIDTGARHTHQGLFSNYRGTRQGSHNYNWFSPSGGAATNVPSDANGHGTHVLGSIVGTTNGMGVAPGATWIQCTGCPGACPNFDLLQCGNFMACPTTVTGTAPNCAQAPHFVNNSWGGGRGSTFYDGIIAAWRAANIVPIFSAGNSGPACNTVISPSDRPGAISVGSTTVGNVISGFSSRGATPDGRRKPDVSAPGTAIVSAGHQADNQYRTLSGTSMAGPHVAGVVALVLSRRPTLTVAQVEAILNVGNVAIGSSGQTCVGIPDTVRPNHQVGQGRIDAVHANNA